MSELLIIAFITLIILGPKDIPKVLRFFSYLKHQWQKSLNYCLGFDNFVSKEKPFLFFRKLPYSQVQRLKYATRKRF